MDSKGVDLAFGVDHLVHPRALFGEKTCVLRIGLRIFEIDLAMSDVEIAADHDFASSFAQFLQALLGRRQELEFVREPRVIALAIREVAIDQRELS